MPALRLPSPSPGFRLSVFYGLIFAVVGISLPFWPVWLANRGLDADQIGLVLGIAMATKVVAVPIWTQVADRRGTRKALIVLLSAGTLAVYVGYVPAHGFAPLLALAMLASACFSSVMPLTEVVTLGYARGGRLDYGRVRLWGSVAFVAASAVAGTVLAGGTPDRVLWLLIAAFAAMLLGSLAIPDLAEPPSQRPGGLFAGLLGGAVPVLRHRGLVRLFVAAGLIQGSHSVYYAFSALDWRAAGFSSTVVGALWAEGVLAEIVLFALGAGLIRRLGAGRLVALGGALGVVRWTGSAWADGLWSLALLQALHAFSFGAAHLGAMAYLQERSPQGLSATAQGLYSALPLGLGAGLLYAMSGQLYALWGTAAYLAMAAMAAVGTLVALRLR
jgi:PPP family 3-phenylpropionic acid transporter